MPQTTAARGFRGNDGRAGASEWPQFQAQARPTGEVVDTATIERQRTVTSSAEEQADRASPRPRGTGAGTLPPPRSSMGGVGQTNSGRSSPSVEKKADGTIGVAKTGMAAGLSSNGPGYVDTITDQFSNVSSAALVRSTRD